ncbi:hypothetical protein DACRYDRAFT_110469 [Dacryopinax primogenitus]|uniref:Uncharacterized protein n=1 Tax=Dacryopinax primogenitus (strain DJM 731) TaxID=1858805 RepID=M5G5W6_DACPD|nr:uncharacterized protein DACRYDRAFT_110469 [Dacryopinax primogenitus]EJT99152.1 hypothetical protein DACRYDRAFT_110469 [Dacryopinax primogenitus]
MTSASNIEDEGRVVPLFINGDKIVFRMEGGIVHQIRVDLTNTKTHPNFPPSTPYKKLKARIVKEWRSTRARSSKVNISILDNPPCTGSSHPIPRDRPHGKCRQQATEPGYRIHEDGTLSGKKLPALPAGRAYTLAYVNPPLLSEVWRPSEPRSSTKFEWRGPHRTSERPVSNPSVLGSKGKKRARMSDYFKCSHRKSNDTHGTKTGTRALPFNPSKKRKRRDVLSHMDRKSLTVRIRGTKLTMAPKTMEKYYDSSDSDSESEVEEPLACWSTTHMYPLTERYHTMYNCDHEEAKLRLCSISSADGLNIHDISLYPSIPSHISARLPEEARECIPTETEMTEMAILAALAAMEQSFTNTYDFPHSLGLEDSGRNGMTPLTSAFNHCSPLVRFGTNQHLLGASLVTAV